jgi:hypothetical protein
MTMLKYLYSDSVDLSDIDIAVVDKVCYFVLLLFAQLSIFIQQLATTFECHQLSQLCQNVKNPLIVVATSTFVPDLRSIMFENTTSIYDVLLINTKIIGAIEKEIATDITFTVEDDVIKAHKAILAHRCRYFERI